ncbi:lytic transglycosylase domain-containing protein [Erythrobacter sp.]|uniref:lytic transglycosylase domain-containing protein n=1 Tax=Erythrobacter sp. TaxID=1042 RepID=UPI0025C1F32F|nr:lytic transglycosylase domain-containing protein [Erythrobacter sp.]
MILARLALVLGLSCAALSAFPARADVMEIDADGARWLTGGGTALPAAQNELAASGPLAEVPADLVVPDIAVADPVEHARLVPEGYKAKVAELAARFDLSPTLIEAVVWQESRWRANAVSPVGARGLAQLMPGTARDLGVDPDDPFANLEGGARYLREQLDRFDGDLEKALAAYNAGPGRVIRAGGIPRIRETQHYVAAIMGRLSDHSRE